MNWLKSLNPRTRFKEPLSAHTTLAVGGPAEAWVEPDDFVQLSKIIVYCSQQNIPYLIIGQGSNVLISDAGFTGVVICLNSACFTKIEVEGEYLCSGAGLALSRLIRETAKIGLGGLEFLAGIPASVGGALVMNAGSRQIGIGNFAQGLTVMDSQGKKRLLKDKQLSFGYRKSNLNRYIVLEARLKLSRTNPDKIQEKLTRNLSQKRKIQDLTAKSAGCTFKNPNHRLSAAEMLQACGLKRRRCGGAQISGKHANYIVNRNGATARDILYLIDLAQREVQQRFGVLLEPEIRIIK